MKFIISDEAMAEFEKQVKEFDMTNKSLKLYIMDFRCKTPYIGVALDDIKDNDIIEDFGNFKLSVESDFEQHYPEVTINYVDNQKGKSGFVISTNTQGGCGCGGSGNKSGCSGKSSCSGGCSH